MVQSHSSSSSSLSHFGAWFKATAAAAAVAAAVVAVAAVAAREQPFWLSGSKPPARKGTPFRSPKGGITANFFLAFLSNSFGQRNRFLFPFSLWLFLETFFQKGPKLAEGQTFCDDFKVAKTAKRPMFFLFEFFAKTLRCSSPTFYKKFGF